MLRPAVYQNRRGLTLLVPACLCRQPWWCRERYPRTILDQATSELNGRLGCKPYASTGCTIVWTGPGANLMFVRR